MIRATPDDLPALRAFLTGHAATSMHPLANLDRHGMDGPAPRSMSFWLARDEGAITDALGVSTEGFVFPVCPTLPLPAITAILARTGVKGMIGEARQVAALRKAAGLTRAAPLDAEEPHYHLDLTRLVMPDTTGLRLVPLSEDNRTTAEDWRSAFAAEALGYPADEAPQKGQSDVTAFIDADSHRLLMQGDTPLAMTGFNAEIPGMVQVGGVYTPPDLRGRGYARAAVALHLAEARAKGTTEAVLSAATASAAHAYEAIGFTRIGDFSIVAWPDRQVVHG